MIRAIGVSVGIIWALIGMGLVHIFAQALIPDPDSLSIEQVTAYSGVINEGDMLVIIQYDIEYATLPDLAATDAYICRFFVAGSEVNNAEIVAFNNLGYGLGVCSVYFTNEQREAAGIEFENPNSENYQVIVQGKPSAFDDPPLVSTLSIQYRSADNTMQLLQADVAELARSLENNVDWVTNGIDLITFTLGQEVLTDDGAAYFGQAVPNLQIMIPDLFGSSTTAPEIFERDYSTSEEDRLLDQWDASPMGPIFQGLADALRISKAWVLGIVGIALMAVGFILATALTGNASFGMLAIPFMFPLAVAAGFGAMTAVFFVTALALIGLMFSLFLRRAG